MRPVLANPSECRCERHTESLHRRPKASCQPGACRSCAGTDRAGFTARHTSPSERGCRTGGRWAASTRACRWVPWCRHPEPTLHSRLGTVKGGRGDAPGERMRPVGGASPRARAGWSVGSSPQGAYRLALPSPSACLDVSVRERRKPKLRRALWSGWSGWSSVNGRRLPSLSGRLSTPSMLSTGLRVPERSDGRRRAPSGPTAFPLSLGGNRGRARALRAGAIGLPKCAAPCATGGAHAFAPHPRASQ